VSWFCFDCNEHHDTGKPCPLSEPIDGYLVEVMPGVVIRPGDVLLLHGGPSLTIDVLTAIREALLFKLPGLVDVVILSPDLHVAGVYRDEAQP
jgi:hypothetical protein